MGREHVPVRHELPSENWFERDTISTNDRLGVCAVDIASTFTFSACGISVMEPLDIDCEPVVRAEVEDAAVPGPTPIRRKTSSPYPVQAFGR